MSEPSRAPGHDHEHDHPHGEIGGSPRPGYYEIMETAVRELLIEKRLIGPDEIRRAYSRGAFWQERVAMSQWWADYLDRLRKGGEVIEMRSAAK